MKRFNEFIKQLSLTQQLFALIFFFVTFFAVFFFVYVNGSVNNAIKEQIFKSLDDTQSTLISANATLDAYSNASNIENYPVMIKNGDTPILIAPAEKNIDTNSREWEQIRNDLLKVMRGNLEKYHGIFKNASNDLDSYYSVLRITDKQYLISKTYSDNMDKLENVLVNSVVYITVIVVGFFFIVLMMWVITLIHPLNQIRNYIERVKLGKDAELHVNRKDEIGELADALVSMRDELLRQEKTKEEMIHNISHDLKTPIATIKSYGESIKDGIYPYDTLEKSVDVIIENADRLEAKVHSLLFMNRVEYLISQDCEGISSNMQEIVETVVQNTKFIKPEITIQTDLEEVWFDGLAEPWRVAVENILENALRYAKTTINIHLSEEEGLTIANDGPCMDEDRIKVLFKPYEKGQGGKFGLGLSIVSKVVNANHYEVCGENTADGVIFRINKPKTETKKGR
ncbi:sensor histidine kinase [Longicatena caecimuris]|uniref:histidine kinase n=1 Tax=Longicatena caecimuris TaxID=1796635 RepID=A0A4R3TDC5_9FIRM|nr:HAMP domain-containing sensor histidine kinase [Longicatena caecimuris]MCR1870304.1 HAMP domain-containing histidine kinase [Longicatena caecimuris]MCU0101704.1 HAMP domain-containing histidine kinase [Longicatena caecimuris]TCU59269.1 two-component system sensor histidine kinase CssS [Longicatena caecimuris]